ncbi:UvrD-helicase domain-containing protein [Myxococcus sp. RHSTA-1-4]|uniref:UvrD-helicase domain-containing protein n=1 Tax=Myxococcus sp. RHSTA-1-4 TaxID=2874601 RepID=UPI001CBE10C0|nr:UvrD-helicase domain-containing protein [Myxococcus sp. RHSTA-1-4]MBZ4415520.1 AAA family ATPase [Myxococcus sp. RHSTA-1-4]
MTSRIEKPDTEADQKLRACLDGRPPASFVMVAGAGSGKTTSLVKALDYLAQTKGAELRRRGQQIACITYTDVAVGEIWGDVGNAPLFHVSTIHSFLWTVVRPFQNDLRNWVEGRLREKIAESEEKIASPKTRDNTRERLSRERVRYQLQSAKLGAVSRFTYGAGSDYANGILGHDDVLRIGPALISNHSLLRTLIANRFPFIFVDESQDTHPPLVAALKQIADTAGTSFCLGFFGDPMQRIYPTGTGPITPGAGWTEITKQENFRCSASVLRVINQIRAEDDGLHQIRGRTVGRKDGGEQVEGTARLFILPADERRSERLADVRRWLAKANNDPLWESDGDDGNVRVLVLVHRMAARRLSFSDIYAALNDDGAPANLRDGLLDGTAWVLRPFMTYLLPLALAARARADFDVISILRKHCPLLTKEHISGKNAAEVLTYLKNDVDHFVGMTSNESTHSIREVLTFVRNRELSSLDERFMRFLADTPTSDESDESDPEHAAVSKFLNCPAAQLWGYRAYIEDESPFATQQGVKGAEFQRVLVVLDDEESDYNLFSYGKYFGSAPLSERDQKISREGGESVISRTRRLFYVCCSRATQDLAVVLFAPDVERANKAVASKGIFPRNDVYVSSINFELG